MPFFLTLALAAAPPPVVNGQPTTNYPEVGMLFLADATGESGAMCTGSVLDAHWVLTAGHCVSEEGTFTIDKVYITFANQWSEARSRDWIEATDWIPHPDFDPDALTDDIGLVHFGEVLDAPAMQLTDVSPAESDIGEPFRIVGYGRTSEDDAGEDPTKHAADAPLSDYDSQWLWLRDSEDGRSGCFGDSGGPVLRLYADGSYAQAGVTSWGITCDTGATASTRIENYEEFLADNGIEYTIYGDAAPSFPDHDEDLDPDDGSADDASSYGFDEPAAACDSGGSGPIGLLSAMIGLWGTIQRRHPRIWPRGG